MLTADCNQFIMIWRPRKRVWELGVDSGNSLQFIVLYKIIRRKYNLLIPKKLFIEVLIFY